MVRSLATVISDGLTFNEGTEPLFDTVDLNLVVSRSILSILMGWGISLSLMVIRYLSLSRRECFECPQGYEIEDNYLYIADVGQVVAYNLDDLSLAPVVVPFPEGELYVNDIAINDNVAYITVTNTGNIYALDISSPADMTASDLSEYTTLSGANGVTIEDDVMYVASYAPDENTTDINVIYKIEDLDNPQPIRLIDRMGQYDGLEVEDDKLYFSNWVGGEVGYVDLATGEVRLI